jgi:hypothetical protein
MPRLTPSGVQGGAGAPWRTAVTVEELGPANLGVIAARMAAPEFGDRVFRAAETEEERIFDSYGGKYVRTGLLKGSLTEHDAPGAIRVLRPGELLFGTSVWYARFQGTTGTGRHSPPSAILKASAVEAAAAAADLKDYILYGNQERLLG